VNNETGFKRQGDIGEKEYPIYLYFVFGLIGITIGFIILRILIFYFNTGPYIARNKDVDYFILIEGMKNGIVNFYNPIDKAVWPPYYLYFWYFLFFPMYLIPIEIGVYIWDMLRLISVGYVFFKAKEIFVNQIDLILFYILCSIGFAYDAFFNNVNFVIFFFLFLSYIAWENDKKWLAGIFFTLATFKINAIVFLPVLLIIKKIKLKDLYYYLIPFFLICIPYIIFPNYFAQMLNNWMYSDERVQGILFGIDSIAWKALQPSHLMYISLLIIIFLENLENISLENRRQFFRILFPTLLMIYYVYLTIIVHFIGRVSA
jgi:hypothetical protein